MQLLKNLGGWTKVITTILFVGMLYSVMSKATENSALRALNQKLLYDNVMIMKSNQDGMNEAMTMVTHQGITIRDQEDTLIEQQQAMQYLLRIIEQLQRGETPAPRNPNDAI
tara:strand:- start:254 stop:589 length:336 start_codon:yes stop_codon:yes gene_type:complete